MLTLPRIQASIKAGAEKIGIGSFTIPAGTGSTWITSLVSVDCSHSSYQQ
jgi:hypothetical protein